MTAAALHAPAARRAPDPVRSGLAWGGAAVAIWGVYLAVARAGVAHGAAPSDLAFLRYAVAGVATLPWFARFAPAQIRRLGWARIATLAVLAGPPFVLASAGGFRLAPLSHGAVVQPGAITVAGLALGALLLGDRVTRGRLAGAGVILAGLAVVAGPGALAGGAASLGGDALFALAGAMWAAFAILSRRWAVPPLVGVAIISVLSAAVYAPLHLATAGVGGLLAQSPATLLQQAVVQGLLSGVLAVFAFGRAVELLGAARAAALPALVPVVATLAGIPIAGELPTLFQIAGLAVVTAGLLVTQTRPDPRQGD